MKQTFSELIEFLKNPVLGEDGNTNDRYRFTKFLHILAISILTGICLIPLIQLVDVFGIVDLENHAMEDLMKNFSKAIIFLLAAVLAPFVEELIFRAPLTAFSKRYFKFGFYVLTILFGLVHLTNYEISTNVLLVTPILVAPQIILGGYLGFVRVKFGLLWSILLHATYNAFFILISFAGDLL